MKIAFTASLVLLFLLVEVQGIRLEKWFASDDHQNVQEEKKNKVVEIEKSGGTVADSIATCKMDGHCSSGRNRKLLKDATSSTTTTTITTSESGKSGMGKANEGKENLSVKKLQNSSEKKKSVHEEYPDIMDIAGMDYSTAKRKSPIHN